MFFPNKLNEKRLAKVLKRARSTLDVAVFAFTNNKLAKAILHCWNRGVKCRAITDDECAKFSGADIYLLAAAGIPCTMDNHARYHMHNKFALIDSEVLVTGKLTHIIFNNNKGSFNWTSQAVTGNQENLMVVENRELVRQYQEEFDRILPKF